MTKAEIDPFLKWPGGKRWLTTILCGIFAAELKNTYYEPFLGAGAMYLSLRPKSAILSDKNKELIAFLNTVKRNPSAVVRAVWRWSNEESCYYRVRESAPRTEIGKAARFLYLNRTCWGGIYRLNRKGEFNVPFGNSGRTICRHEAVVLAASAFRRAKLLVADFEEVMENAKTGDVIYADPPYTTRGAGNGFVRYNESIFSWQDQLRLADAARQAADRGSFVAVSGLNHVEFLELYPNWFVAELQRPSNVGRDVFSRRQVCEAVVFSRRPVVDGPQTSLKVRQLP
jgi:DNA adenine methylase